MQPRTWIRKQANDLLREAGEEKRLRTFEFNAALDYFCSHKRADWLIEQKTAGEIEELDQGRRQELDEAADSVFADTMAARRVERERLRRRHNAGGQTWRPYDTYAPEWWDLEAERLFKQLRPLQGEALTLVNPPGQEGELVKVEDVAAELSQLADDSIPSSVDITLEVPYVQYDTYNEPELTTSRLVFPGQLPLTAGGRLARFEALALRVEEATGCRQGDAIGFLLCDRVPWVPAVEVLVDKRVMSTVIRVHHPEVPVEVVAAAYKDWRRELGGRTDTRHRTTSGWPVESSTS